MKTFFGKEFSGKQIHQDFETLEEDEVNKRILEAWSLEMKTWKKWKQPYWLGETETVYEVLNAVRAHFERIKNETQGEKR